MFDELDILNDIRKSVKVEYFTKLKNSSYRIPVAILAFIFFCILFFVSWFAGANIQETSTIEPEYHIYYDMFGEMSEDDKIEISYNADRASNINFYIFTKLNYDSWFNNQNYFTEVEIEDESSGELTFVVPEDGVYYVVFENLNSESVSVDVQINDVSVAYYAYFCFLPLSLMLLVLFLFLLIPQKLLLKSESRTFQFDHYNIDKSFYGNILFGFGWLFGLVSVVMIALYIQSIFVSDSTIRSFYIFIVLTLTISSSHICFRYSESYGYKNPWKVFLN